MIKYILLFVMLFASITSAQSFEIERVTGNVKFISGSDNQWKELTLGMKITSNAIISTEVNSTVKLKGDDVLFTLKESSAIAVSNIKKMNIDELLLALAMENIINTPRKGKGEKSNNTAVYGTKITDPESIIEPSIEFGTKRLNGAKQLAENGMKESAIITAMEVYRKYPETKTDASNRIFFADLLFEKKLYEEAYDQYNEIKAFTLNDSQAQYVSDKLNEISKKLLNR
ncbi:MAG: hypothetical protein KGZ85_09470 [Ignavibacterium sp.]|nr:hypothetical protein [Ignavibacterium sp.]